MLFRSVKRSSVRRAQKTEREEAVSMAMTEKAALARVLKISHVLYSALSKDPQAHNYIAALDSLSAAISHCNNAERPLEKCLRALKRELKAADRELYRSVKQYFSFFYPVLDYDFEKAAAHIPSLIYGNDMICQKLSQCEYDKAKAMADAMKSLPGYLFGEFESLTPQQFYDLVFGFYPKLYDEPFMDEMKHLFK